MTELKNKVSNELNSNSNLISKIELLKSSCKNFLTYESLDELFFKLTEEDYEKSDYKKFIGIFNDIIKIILTEFRSNEIYPSPNLTSEILYDLIKNENPSDLISKIIDYMHLYGLLDTSIIIYPLISFGIQDLGFQTSFFKNIDLNFRLRNCIVFTQQNNIDKTKGSINKALEYFKMKKYKLNNDLMDHYIRSRPLEWFYHNPLLFLKINYSSYNYYENEFFLVRNLERQVSLIYLTYTIIINENTILEEKGFPTSICNNFITKDIKHYLVLSKNKNELDPQCVPIHRKHSRFIEVSNINVDIPINFNDKIRKFIDNICLFVENIYNKTIKMPKDKNDFHNNFFHKLKSSINYFVRSFQSRYEDEEILFLCIAYEIILSEGVKENISITIKNNLLFIFKDNSISENITKLYNARSGVAHEGVARDCNIDASRRDYIKLLIKIEDLIKKGELDIKQEKPFSEGFKKRIKNKLGYCPAFT